MKIKTYTLKPANGQKKMYIDPMLKTLGFKSEEVAIDELEAFMRSDVMQEDNTDETLYVIDKIVCNNSTYHFTIPLWCMLLKEDDCFTIESEMMDITVTGKTLKEAKNNFFKQFDYIYTSYNKLPKSQTTYKIFRIKNFLKSKVVKT